MANNFYNLNGWRLRLDTRMVWHFFARFKLINADLKQMDLCWFFPSLSSFFISFSVTFHTSKHPVLEITSHACIISSIAQVRIEFFFFIPFWFHKPSNCVETSEACRKTKPMGTEHSLKISLTKCKCYGRLLRSNNELAKNEIAYNFYTETRVYQLKLTLYYGRSCKFKWNHFHQFNFNLKWYRNSFNLDSIMWSSK